MKLVFSVSILFLLLLPRVPVCAAFPDLDAALKPVQGRDPALAGELRKLAEASPKAKKLILADPRQTNDPAATMYYLWELAYRVLEQNHWWLKRSQNDYPHLCKAADLVACVRAADLQHYAVFMAGLDFPITATEDKKEGFTFSNNDEIDLPDDILYDWDVAPDPRGEVLLARWSPRVMSGDKTERVITEYLYIRNQKLKRLKRVTEEYPLAQ